MSLVTLTSRANPTNPNSNDPSFLRNHYKDGIKLRKGTEVALISLTFNKISMIEIIAGVNDTISWRIGDRTNYLTKAVTISPGEYTGTTLATEMARAFNAATILGNFKGTWAVTFNADAFENKGSFSITYDQNEVPASSGQVLVIYDGSDITIDNTGPKSVITGTAGQDEYLTPATPVIITGARSVFANDGEVVSIIKPIQGYNESAFETAMGLDDAAFNLRLTDQAGATTSNCKLITYTGANGWDYELDFDGGASQYWLWDGDTDEGSFFRGSADVDATVPANRDLSKMLYNKTATNLRDAAAGGRTTETAGAGFVLSTVAAGGIVPVATNQGYGTSIVGIVRNSLYKGRTDYAGNPNADITSDMSTGDMGFDYMVKVRENAAFDGMEVDFGQLLLDRTKSFPTDADWNGDSRFVFQDASPDGWNNLGTAPAVWTGFTYPDDHIRVRVSLANIRTVVVEIAHDTAGDGVFLEEVKLAQTGTTAGTGDDNAISRNIKEWFYPYRPVLCCGRGGRYFPSEFEVSGVFDATELTNSVYQTAGLDDQADIADETDSAIDLGVSSPTNAVTLSALFIAGEIFNDDIGAGVGQIPSGDVPANRKQNNIFDTIGTPRFSVIAAGNPTNSFESIQGVTEIVREPNLMVELSDFNIEGHNGDTSDKAKLIAVIPSEELNTNSKTGTMNYYPHFPIFIDLNLAHDRTVYDLNATLRSPEGKVVEDLINPTTLTLLLRDGEETRQERMALKIAENLRSTEAGIQQIKIDRIGRGNPLV